MDALQGMGFYFLFRVPGHVLLKLKSGNCVPLHSLLKPGSRWSGYGPVFKKAGWRNLYIRLLWRSLYRSPWCLLTNHPRLPAEAYARRAWQEQAFRDLKSGGFAWQRSRVFCPAHAQRLLLVLALAYAFVSNLGVSLYARPRLLHRLRHGARKRFSLFRLGLRFFDFLRAHARSPVLPDLAFPSPLRT